MSDTRPIILRIRDYRREHGCTLVEAKVAVEAAEHETGDENMADDAYEMNARDADADLERAVAMGDFSDIRDAAKRIALAASWGAAGDCSNAACKAIEHLVSAAFDAGAGHNPKADIRSARAFWKNRA